MSAAVGRSASSTGTPFGSVDLRPYMRAQPSATRLGNSVSSNEAGSTITPSFSGNVQRVFYFNDTNTAAGGLFNLDAEL